MSNDHDQLRRDLGVYVLGALEPVRREQVERHLADCSTCRDELTELAALPGLLNRLREEPDLVDITPPAVEPALVRVAEERRRWRVRTRLALAAALAAVVALLIVVVAAIPSSPAAVTFASTDRGAVAAVEARRWGMMVDLEVRDLPERPGYVLEAVALDGHRAQVATWRHVDGPIRLQGACYLSPDEVERLQVLAARTDEVVAILEAE
jgi:hypothetical protein